MDAEELTPEEKALLRHEAFIAEVLKQRSEGDQESLAKPRWQVVLESAGGAAIITVLIGGAFTAWITHRFQGSEKEREFQNEIVKLYGQHRLTVQEKETEERFKTLQASLRLIGTVMNRGQDKIDIDLRRFARKMDPELKKKDLAQEENIRHQYNEAFEQWRTEKGALEPQIGYYFGEDARRAWKETAQALEAFLRCADRHHPTAEDKDLCKDKETRTAEEQVQVLIDTLVRAPTKQWLVREDVEYIRCLLVEDSTASPARCLADSPLTTSGPSSSPSPESTGSRTGETTGIGAPSRGEYALTVTDSQSDAHPGMLSPQLAEAPPG